MTDGRRYAQYGEREREVIRDAVTRYGEYAGHLFIAEGVGDIGVTAIRERIARHIDMTGKTPLVIVDYLQIGRALQRAATDKPEHGQGGAGAQTHQPRFQAARDLPSPA